MVRKRLRRTAAALAVAGAVAGGLATVARAEPATSPNGPNDVGYSLSLQVDRNSFPVVVSYDDTTGKLTVMHCNDEYCAGGDESNHQARSAR